MLYWKALGLFPHLSSIVMGSCRYVHVL